MRRNSCGEDRGAVMLELAILVPVLAVLAFGIINYSIGWRTGLVVNTATRDAARMAASDAVQPSADYDALTTLRAGLSDDQLANLSRVVVYKSDSSGAVPAKCLQVTPNANGSGVSGVCNVYAPAVVRNPSTYVTKFSTKSSCGALDGYWCPTARDNTLSLTTTDTPDSLGVYVQTRYDDITHTLFPSLTITRTAVMRLVPAIR